MYPPAGTPYSQPYSQPYRPTQYPPYPPYGPGGGGGYGLPPAELNQYPTYRGRGDNQPHMPSSFDDITVRSKFIRKVYTILSMQLGFTILFILPFMLVDKVQEFVYDYSWVSFVFLAVFIVPYMMLVCCESTRRSFPTNMILLSSTTVGMAGICGFTTARMDTELVFYTVLLTAAVTVSVTIMSIFCPFDITSCQMLLCLLSVIIIVFGIIATFLVFVMQSRILSLVYSGLCVVLFSLFLMFDTQAIIGGRRIELSPEEYVLAAIQLYVDIVLIFLHLLQLLGACTESH